MNSPVVSIFMPAYNGELYLALALESLLNQTYRNFEIVVVNDGSTDRTQEIAQAFASRDARVRVVSLERNTGLSAARNTGWQNASPNAKFIMNHDCDDLSLPTKLERLVKFLEMHPVIAAVGSFCRYIDQNGRELGYPPMEWRPENIRRTFGELNSMAISATLCRRNVYDSIAQFRPEYGGCDDYDFWARSLSAGFNLANIPHVLHYIRIHQTSMGATQTSEMAAHARTIAMSYNETMGSATASPLSMRILSKTLRARMRLRLALSYLSPSGDS